MKEILPKEACLLLKINKNTLYKWGDKGILKMTRSGVTNIRVFDRDDVMRLARKLPKKRGRAVWILPTKAKRK